MQRVSIVILNYLNYKDTIECVNSIFDMEYDLVGIVIVDNASYNDSFKVLHGLYKNNKKIIVVKANKNYGYAKGNNIGIRLAKQRFKAEFVFVVNNDTLFIQRNFFVNLLQNYEKGIGVIGPLIILKNDGVQQQFLQHVDFRDNLLMYIYELLESRNKSMWINILPELDMSKRVRMLHGCAIMLTPDFFQYYEGFYSRTFLYLEEVLLYLMCKRCGLVMRFVKEAQIYHKEDRSSEMSFANNKKQAITYAFKSHKYVLWWIIKCKFENFIKNAGLPIKLKMNDKCLL